jgi:outer membrane protein TolC
MLNFMTHKFNRFILILLPVAGLLSVGTVKSQPLSTDSLSLKSIISEVVQNHPMVRKALEDLNNSDAKIGFAKSATLPNVDFESSYSRIGPIENITIPNLGSFSLMPHDNYTAGFNLNQTISDFGKTEKNISLEKQSKELNLQTVEDVRQKLSKAVINNYYALVYLQEAIKIKDEQISTLNEHLHYIQKKLETGSATQYEILSTQVRISAIENQKTDLETAKQVQTYQLNSLLGKPVSNVERVKNELNIVNPGLQSEALITAALQNRDEMKLAREKAKLAEIRYSITDYQNKPVLSGFLSAGVKDGYIPYMNDPKANFVAGIGVKVPVFDGHRKTYNQLQAKSAIQVNDQETEIVRRNIIEEVVESQSNLQASQKKVDQSELQLKQATQAYALAKVSFDSGVITNLELLDGSTAVSESRLMVLKSKIDFTVNIYKLKSAIGERLY